MSNNCEQEVNDLIKRIEKQFIKYKNDGVLKDGIIEEVSINNSEIRFKILIGTLYDNMIVEGSTKTVIATTVVNNKTLKFLTDEANRDFDILKTKIEGNKKNIEELYAFIEDMDEYEDDNDSANNLVLCNTKMITQKSLIEIKKNLDNTFSKFQTYSEVRAYAEREVSGYIFFRYTSNHCDEVFDSAIKELRDDINNKIVNISKEIDQYINQLDSINCLLGYKSSYDNTFDNIAIGAGVGIGAAVLLGATVFPLLAVGAAIGYLWNANNKKEELIQKIIDAAKRDNGIAIEKIKELLDKLIIPNSKNKKIVNEYVDKKELNLTNQQLEIKNYLEERKIKYLVHFSSVDNHDSILKNGILSNKEASKYNVFIRRNDNNLGAHKPDRIMKSTPNDYISLSITSPNKDVLAAYRFRGELKKVKVYYIDASILWMEINNDRIYCNMNAASSAVKCGKNMSAFEEMFAEKVYNNKSMMYCDRIGKNSYETTDSQAEILFEKRVDPKYILYSEDL